MMPSHFEINCDFEYGAVAGIRSVRLQKDTESVLNRMAQVKGFLNTEVKELINRDGRAIDDGKVDRVRKHSEGMEEGRKIKVVGRNMLGMVRNKNSFG